MAATSKRVVFLTGAPTAASLTWAHSSGLGPRFRRYLGTADRDDEVFLHTQTQETATHPLAKWRHIPLKDEVERNERPPSREAPQFLSFEDELEDQPSQEHMKFLEHSLAVLQNLDSSQIAIPDQTTYDETTFVSDLSFNSTLLQTNSYGGSFSTTASTGEPSQQIVNFTGQITDLRKIPTARHLESIHPQTMTINILASVISIRPTRTVKLRKRAGEMDIVEVLVGDETRAGFNISFWLAPTDSQRPDLTNSMRDMLSSLRSGDVLLITHIALGEFKGNVYGQSLSKRITRNNTSIIKLSGETIGLPAQTMAKLKRVIAWTGDFVGRPAKRPAGASFEEVTNGKRRAILPPDTQPGEL